MPRTRSDRLVGAGLFAVLVGQLALGLYGSSRLSATVDECAYVPAGVTYWHTHDHRLSTDHPLLMKYLLGALPSLARPHVPAEAGWRPVEQADQWRYGLAFQAANGPRFQGLIVLARAAPILLAAATTLIVFLWTRRLWGPWVGLCAAVACALEPNLLAHGQLATLDMGVTFFMVAALWQWSVLGGESVGWRRVVRACAAGLAFGCAATTKFTGLVLGPVLVAWAVVRIARPRPTEGGPGRWSAVASLALVLAVGWLWINLLGGFRGTFKPLAGRSLESAQLQRLQAGPLGRIPALAPERYVAALDKQLQHSGSGQGVYIDGRLHRRGVWYYFLYALALKTPPAMQLLFLLGVGAWLAGRPARSSRSADAGVGLALLAVLVVGAFSNLQMGLRYVLPVLPLAAVVVARGVAWLGRRRAGAVAAGLLVLAGAADSLRSYPDMLGYFNAYAGDGTTAWRRLADSNLDWGQGLLRLRSFLEQRRPQRLFLAYWGRALPQVYGIGRWRPPGPEARPGTYVVSVNFLAGIPYQIHYGGELWKVGKKHSKGTWYCAPSDGAGGWDRSREYALNWLMTRPVDSHLGYGLVVYEVGARPGRED